MTYPRKRSNRSMNPALSASLQTKCKLVSRLNIGPPAGGLSQEQIEETMCPSAQRAILVYSIHNRVSLHSFQLQAYLISLSRVKTSSFNLSMTLVGASVTAAMVLDLTQKSCFS